MEINDSISKNPLALAVFTVLKVMRADHAGPYAKAYKNEARETEAMRRAYTSLKGVDPKAVIDAYDEVAKKKPQFLPDVFEIVFEAKRIDRHRKSDAHNISNKKELPKPVKSNGVAVKMLATAQKKVSDASGRDTEEEWLKRKEEALLDLNRKTAGLTRKYADRYHTCGYPDCRKAGTITNSTNGSENWYCNDHAILG